MRCVTVTILCAAMLTACGHAPEPRIVTKDVMIAVPVSCLPKGFPTPPSGYADDVMPEGQDAAPERYRRTAQANEERKARLALAEPVIAGCR